MKGKKKMGRGGRVQGTGGSWGDTRATGRAARAEPRGWNPDARRGRGRRDSGWGPPGGAGDHQTLHRPETVSWRECRKELEPRLASPRGPGQGRPPTPPRQCLPTPPPALGRDSRPTGPARPLTPSPGSPSPTLPRDPGP